MLKNAKFGFRRKNAYLCNSKKMRPVEGRLFCGFRVLQPLTKVKTTFELGSCSYENDGEEIYVSSENDYYTCTYSYTSYGYEYTWVGEKVKSSSSITVSSSSSDICDVFYCWDETESSSSVNSSSSTKSSSSVSDFLNVSDVWNGKMVKPSTD